MKKLVLLSFLVMLAFSSIAQDLNKVIVDTSINKEILFGYCNRIAFENELFTEWFNSEYESYEVNDESLSILNFDDIAQTQITVVMATWCSDSRREVPRFYKILDALNYDFENLTLINVNRQKSAGDVPTEQFNVELVPTIIVFENGIEKGRIIERPINSLEKDFAEIILNASNQYQKN